MPFGKKKKEEAVNFTSRSSKTRDTTKNYGTASEAADDDGDSMELVDSQNQGSPAFLIKEVISRQARDKMFDSCRKLNVDSNVADPNAKESELSTVFTKQWEQYYHWRLRLVHLLLIIYFCAYLFLCIIFKSTQDYVSDSIIIAILATSVFYCLVVFLLSLWSTISQRHTFQAVVSMLTASLMPSIIWTCVIIPRNNEKLFHGLPAMIMCLSIMYTCLKLPQHLGTIWCFLISIGHLFLICFLPTEYSEKHVQEVSATVLCLVTTNILGYFHSYYLQTCRRKSYGQFNDAVEKRTIVEYEKERQEQLLLSIIPVYLAAKVRKTILNRTSKTRESIDYSSEPPKMFQDLHVQQHENVSILFADIVNFTPLTAELTAAELVRFLNELYSRFDTLAQDFQCMRIKILGDCYYCVSGMPVSRPNHADNCVKMGLAMIDAIKVLREATSVNMDMRIGIHSGSVLCGLLGLKKWQYDIWSDDVTLANRMESAGSPGKLHITKATMQQLSGRYKIDPSATTDPYFQKHGIETYFIVPSSGRVTSTHSAYELKTNTINGTSGPSCDSPKFQDRTKSFSNRHQHQLNANTLCKTASKMSKMVEFWGAESPFSNLSRRRSSDHIRSASINLIANSFEAQDIRRIRLCCFGESSFSDFNILLQHRDKEVESSYWFFLPVNSNFVTCIAIFASIFMASIGLIVNRSDFQIVFYSAGIISLSLMLILPLAQFVKEKFKSTVASRIVIMERFRLSNDFISIVVLFIGGCLSLLNFVSCPAFSMNCLQPYFLPMCQLFMIMLSTIFYLNFIIKCLVMIIFAVFLHIGFFCPSNRFDNQNSSTVLVNTSMMDNGGESILNIGQIFNIFPLAILLVAVMWLCKIYWACLMTFKGEQDDVETMQNINTILLQNILPDHVAAHFLQPERNPADLYHENHLNVCVMFASIPNFKDFWSEWDFSRKLECLRLLNEIVCDFDKLLSKPKFSNVEKIKTVSSTYMAAAGLHPSQASQQDPRRFVAGMVEFAFAIMNLLDQLNRDSFQNFQLRIGLSYGPVIAGVVGAQKPQYDIFGNTVNLASRMDTHGEMGKIHATPEAAAALMAMGYEVESRGLIKVKGVKDELETFFILPPQDRKSTIVIN